MSADNQLSDHGDLFPEGIVNAASQHLFNINALDMVLKVMNWYKTEIAHYFHKWCFFHVYYHRENVNRTGIMWVKASGETVIPCETARNP